MAVLANELASGNLIGTLKKANEAKAHNLNSAEGNSLASLKVST